MATKKNPASCPKCGSHDVAGLVAAFWVGVDAEGLPDRPLHECVEGNTELGPERQCGDCNHEWEDEA